MLCLTLWLVTKKDELITFRTTTALKSAAAASAEADHRSVASVCEIALMQYLERRGEWPPRPKARRRAGAVTESLRTKRG
jgi:hypothetical protein